MTRSGFWLRTIICHRVAALVLLLGGSLEPASAETPSLTDVFGSHEIVVLADVKHGVTERIAFFSSEALFASMQRSGVRHVAIEIPRVLGRQAMTIETEEDVETFVQDVVRAGQWHFTDPENPRTGNSTAQHLVPRAIGRQVLLAKRYGINPIFYDFNNPLGGFSSFNDPIYRCLAQLSLPIYQRYGLQGKFSKAQRDAAIMRERFSHDDELAAVIEHEVKTKGAGKLVIIPGYAHAVMPGGLAERIEARLRTPATVVAVFRDAAEDKEFHNVLWEQARLLSIDLSRPPHFYYTIEGEILRPDKAPGRYVSLDGSRRRDEPAVCMQLAAIKSAMAMQTTPR